MTLRASACAALRSPELYPGWPQQVWVAGTTTSQPAASSKRNAAKPMRGRMRSTRQVTNKPTFMVLQSPNPHLRARPGRAGPATAASLGNPAGDDNGHRGWQGAPADVPRGGYAAQQGAHHNMPVPHGFPAVEGRGFGM